MVGIVLMAMGLVNPLCEEEIYGEVEISPKTTYGAIIGDYEDDTLIEYSNVNPPMENHITKQGGTFNGISGIESWYNLDMTGCVKIMRDLGYSEEDYPVWTRDDGVKMFGDYVMIAADTSPDKHPKGSLMETSMGTGMVVDHCVAATWGKVTLDIAVSW